MNKDWFPMFIAYSLREDSARAIGRHHRNALEKPASNTPASPKAPQHFAAQVQLALRSDSHRELRTIACRWQESQLILTGEVSRYYLKQLCTNLALQHTPDGYTIRNDVQVV